MKQWVLPYVKKQKGLVLLTLLFGFLGIGSGVMLLFVSGYLISKSALRPENIMLVYVPIVAVRAFSIGQALFLYLERLVGHDVVLRIVENMRTKLYKIIEPQALFLRSRYQSGHLFGMVSDDIEQLQNLYLRTIFPSTIALLLYSIIIFVFGLFDLIFALLLIFLLGVLVFLIPIVSLAVTRRRHIQIKHRRSRLYERLTSAVFGVMDWQASGRKHEFLDRYRQEHDALQREEDKVKRWHHLRDGVIQMTIGIVIIATMAWASVQAGEGVISSTVIAAFVLMMMSVTDSFSTVSSSIELLPAYEDSLRRMSKIESYPENERERKSQNQSQATEHVAIELQHVSYRYPNTSKDTIVNASLTVSRGENIALLGKSGTGKSTMIQLITGIVKPYKGSIFVNGVQADRSLLGKEIAVLNQKPHLFDTTVGNNIRIGRPNATDEEIWYVLEQAQLADFIASLRVGLDTPMREMGGRFSGGERQRIALARVLLQNTPIVIFDEPTIGLDPETESTLLTTMFQATTNKTLIFVTHHLASIEKMDQIVFLKNGTVGMKGTHEQLLRENEMYNHLYRLDKGVILS